MLKMNDEYWTPLETTEPIELLEDSVIEFIENPTAKFSLGGARFPSSVGFRGGRLRLGP
jgi:hypothetical protein